MGSVRRSLLLGAIVEVVTFLGFIWSLRFPSDAHHQTTSLESVFVYSQFPGMSVGLGLLSVTLFTAAPTPIQLVALLVGIVVGFALQTTLFAGPIWFVSRWVWRFRQGRLIDRA